MMGIEPAPAIWKASALLTVLLLWPYMNILKMPSPINLMYAEGGRGQMNIPNKMKSFVFHLR